MSKHFFLLWLLLIVAFLMFRFSSFSKIADLKDSIGAIGVPVSNVAETIPQITVEQREKNTSVPPVGQLLDSIETSASLTAPADTTGKTILLLGDSMLENLSPRLAAYADENGHTLYTVIWYGSTTEKWGKTDKIKDYIAKLKPDYIFISLGGNELFVKDIKNKREKYIKKIMADIGAIPFIWIGPPNWKPDTGINNLLKADLPEGTLFVTNGMALDRNSDGAHPTKSAASIWMDSIAKWIPLHASVPIRMNKPGNPVSKPKKLFVHSIEE